LPTLIPWGSSPELHPSFSPTRLPIISGGFSICPHNPGVTAGSSTLWSYIYDFNRFDGSSIAYSVNRRSQTPAFFPSVNSEYGTDLPTAEGGLLVFHVDLRTLWPSVGCQQYSQSSLVNKGQFRLQVLIDRSRSITTDRNDTFYPNLPQCPLEPDQTCARSAFRSARSKPRFHRARQSDYSPLRQRWQSYRNSHPQERPLREPLSEPIFQGPNGCSPLPPQSTATPTGK